MQFTDIKNDIAFCEIFGKGKSQRKADIFPVV